MSDYVGRGNALIGHPGLPLISTPRTQNSENETETLTSKVKFGRELERVLCRIPVFQALAQQYSKEAIRLCARKMTNERKCKSEQLFHAGETITKCYIVLKGSVKLLGEDRVLSTGTCLGDEGLMTTVRWLHTCVVEDNCHVAQLLRSDFQTILELLEERRNMEVVGMVRLAPAFCRLQGQSLERLVLAFKSKEFHREEYVYHAGESSNDLFFIKSGQFCLIQSLTAPSGKILYRETEVSPGDCVGESDLIAGKLRTQSCVCKSERGVVLVLDKRVRIQVELLEVLQGQQEYEEEH